MNDETFTDKYDNNCPMDDLLRELGVSPTTPEVVEAMCEDLVLSDADVAMFEEMVASGSNQEVAALLDADRRAGGELKRRAMRRDAQFAPRAVMTASQGQ